MKFAFFCGCGCGAVKTFEGPNRDQAEYRSRSVISDTHAADRGADSSSIPLLPNALLLAFQYLLDQELFGVVTGVCKTWQTAAAAVMLSRTINIHGLGPGKYAASAAAWLRRYSSHIRELHIYRAEMYPEEWATILSLPFPNLSRLELTRSRLDSSELGLLTQLTSLQELTLNSLGKQLRVSFVNRLGSSLTSLSSLELKSCGLHGEHLQGLTPLVASNLCSLDLFDNPGIGDSSDSSNRALKMWADAVIAAAAGSSSANKQSGQRAGQSATPADSTVRATTITGDASTAAEVDSQAAAPKHEQPVAAGQSEVSPSTDADAAAAVIAASHISVQVKDSGNNETSQELEKPWQQPHQPTLQALRRLQLSYCNIKHLPQLSHLTSLTSLNLQENKCDQETVQAIGQLQQLQELVLKEAVDSATAPAVFAALRGLTNLELLDITGGPPGCLEELFGGAQEAPLAHHEEKAATNGWHGLRVKWSGKGRPPPGFRLPLRRSASGSQCSSPRITGEPVASTTGTTSSVMLTAGCGATSPAACKASRDYVGPSEGVAPSMHSVLVSPAVGPLTPSFEAGDGSIALRSPLTSTGGSGVLVLEDELCSPLPRLRRLEAEQVGLSNRDISNIVRCCTQLQDLDISHNHVGTEGIATLQSLTSLTHLNISAQQPSLADTAAAALVQLKQLKGLDVGGNKFSKQCEVQLQREGSGAGGRLVRLTGCGMRSEVSEPWVTVQLERLQTKHQQVQREAVTPLASPRLPASPKKQLKRQLQPGTTTPRQSKVAGHQELGRMVNAVLPAVQNT